MNKISRKRTQNKNPILKEISKVNIKLDRISTDQSKKKLNGILNTQELNIHWYITFIAGLFTGLVSAILTSIIVLKGEAYFIGLIFTFIIILVLFFLGRWLLLLINNPK